jgi:hypothetical protein
MRPWRKMDHCHGRQDAGVLAEIVFFFFDVPLDISRGTCLLVQKDQRVPKGLSGATVLWRHKGAGVRFGGQGRARRCALSLYFSLSS